VFVVRPLLAAPSALRPGPVLTPLDRHALQGGRTNIKMTASLMS